MKKLGMVLVVLVLAAGVVFGGGAGEDSGRSKVTLWVSGSTNVEEIFQTLKDDFNASQETYELEVQFIGTGGGGQGLSQRVIAAQKAGQKNTTYDIIEGGDNDISSYLNEVGKDMFVEIDKSKIPNASGVTASSSIGQGITQAYRGTTVVMAYNSEAVPNPPATMDELVEWVKANPGRFAYNPPSTGGSGESFVRTSLYNPLPAEAFQSTDEKWMAEWDEGFDFLKEIHPYLYKSGGKVVYPNKNQGTLDLLINKEIDMCPAWADMTISQKRLGILPEATKIYQIEPSFTGSVNSLMIPKMGSNVEGAHAFMNYMLSPAAQNILLSQMAAIPLISQDQLDASAAKDVDGLDVSAFRTQSIGTLGQRVNERWDNEIATLN